MAIKKIMRLPADQFRARGYQTIPSPFFLLKIKKNPDGRMRIGIVVGKTVHATAVKRNFWKRQAIGALASRAAAGNDILMVISPNVDRLTKKQFKEEVIKAMAKTRPQ